MLSAIICSVAVVTATTSGSSSLLGFGFDAAIDAVASVTLVWRFAIEARQPHRRERVERIAETAIGAVLLFGIGKSHLCCPRSAGRRRAHCKDPF